VLILANDFQSQALYQFHQKYCFRIYVIAALKGVYRPSTSGLS
jgi:hypothetical protein